MRRTLLLIMAVAAFSAASAQRIFRYEVDSMRLLLDPAKKDTQQLYIWLRIAEFHINMNGEFQWDLDSARESIKKAKAINAVIHSREAEGYIALVESLLDKEKPEGVAAGEAACRRSIDILLKAHDPLILGKAWLALSFYGDYRDSATCLRKIDYLQKALSSFTEAGHLHLQADCLNDLADLYYNAGQLRNCERSGLLAIQLYKKIGYPELQSSYILVSLAFSDELDYADAVKYSLLALDAVKAMHDSTGQFCQVNNSIGLFFLKLQEWNKAEPYLVAAYGWAQSNKDIPNLMIVQSNLVFCYTNSGQPKKAVALVEASKKTFGIPGNPAAASDAYRNLLLAYAYNGQFEKANDWCQKMLAALRGNQVDRYSDKNAAMVFYILAHRYEDARAMLPVYRASLKNIEEFSARSGRAYNTIFQLDTAQHRYAEAVDDLLQHDKINDSLFRAEKNREVERLQVDYATSEKEHNIQLLQKETEIQKRDITHSNQTRNYSIAGATLLLIAGFGRYRIKQRQTKQLEAKQKEITAKNEQLEKLLHENEWLMREVHHRVKNNLQIITSLLHSQSAFLTDPKAITAVAESQSRVQAMSIIHQKLYKSEDVSTIDMQDYIGDLVSYLRDTARPEQRIHFDVQVERTMLDVTLAIPIGLILNEVITNSIKYAFGQTPKPVIRVWLRQMPDGMIELVAADNGQGLPPDISLEDNNSFGLLLIQGLAQDLDATLAITSHGGLAYSLQFRNNPHASL